MRAFTTIAALVVATAASSQQQPPTFRGGTNVVQVDVRVFSGGQFVTGLTADDFTLKEDGVPQTIQSVVLVGATSPASAPARRVGAASPRVSSTAQQAPVSAPSVWVFVFDLQHLSPAALNHTRAAVLQFLDEKWHQGDLGGVVIDDEMAHNRMTSDRSELRADVASLKMPGSLESFRISMTREWPRFQDEDEVLKVGIDTDSTALQAVVMRACDEDKDACNRSDPRSQVLSKAHVLANEIQQSTLKTLRTVVALSNGLGRMTGPKTVVFVSNGFAIDKFDSQLREAVGDAARAGAHFYTIDARGLDHGSASSSLIDQSVVESPLGKSPRFDIVSDGANSLAVDTGGLVIRNENNFGRALDEIQRDAGTYYVIGYTPTNATFDGKYRTIDVSIKRPGVKVRARRGYLALAPSMLLEPKPIPRPTSLRPASEALAISAVPDLPLDSNAGILDQLSYIGAASPEAVSYGKRNSGPPLSALARVESGVLSLKKFDAADIGAGYAERGWAAYQRGDLESAATQLSAAAATDKRPWVSFALGYAQFGLRQYNRAVDAWTRVKKAVPQFEPVYFDLADALSLEGRESDAVSELRDAEKRWPKDAEVEDAIGVIEVRRTALKAAIESFERATKLAPAEPVGYFNLGRAYQMRFNQSRRYEPAMEKWVGNDDDRDRSIAAYQKYLDLHGPYEQQARDAIALLQWKK